MNNNKWSYVSKSKSNPMIVEYISRKHEEAENAWLLKTSTQDVEEDEVVMFIIQ